MKKDRNALFDVNQDVSLRKKIRRNSLDIEFGSPFILEL